VQSDKLVSLTLEHSLNIKICSDHLEIVIFSVTMETNTNNNVNNEEPMRMVQHFPPKTQRSLPIPKEVNNYILNNYGEVYYTSQDCSQKVGILKTIESQLNAAGYKIRWTEIERRLKNMKSHYRRKKNDLELGIITTVEWEYFQILDKILGAATEAERVAAQEAVKVAECQQQATSSSQKQGNSPHAGESSQKRKVESEPEIDDEPKDL
jgi:hypothetical protein